MPKCPNCKGEIDTVSTEVTEWWHVELFISGTGALESQLQRTYSLGRLSMSIIVFCVMPSYHSPRRLK